jgi:outer membrane protein OmpU
MNKLKKIGLTALAASLVSTSVFAGTMDVTGSAALYFSGGDKVATGNGWSMNDSITFSGGGEMDNGWNITATFLLDNSDGAAAQIFDNRSIAIDMMEAGTLTFWGNSSDSVVSATDDKMPHAYEETWTGATGPGKGATSTNMFYYTNSALVDGVKVSASYTPSGAVEVTGSTEFGVEYTGVDGLLVGFATGTDEGAGAASEVDNTNMYVTYTFETYPITLGYQINSSDSKVADADEDFSTMVISYAVSDDLSVSYGTSEVDHQNNTTDQESTGLGISYTMGSMTLAASHNTHKNAGGLATDLADKSWYELELGFTF